MSFSSRTPVRPRPARLPYSSSRASRSDLPCVSPAPLVPEPHLPPRHEVPHFEPIVPPVPGGSRLVRHMFGRRRTLAASLAVLSAAFAVSAAHGDAPARGAGGVSAMPPASFPAATHHPPPGDVVVRAPVRIADTAVVGMLHPGDKVDVLAASRVVATEATVVAVPALGSKDPAEPTGGAGSPDSATALTGRGDTVPGGTLVVLSVPRRTAAALSGAAASSPLAVTLC